MRLREGVGFDLALDGLEKDVGRWEMIHASRGVGQARLGSEKVEGEIERTQSNNPTR